MIRYIIIAAVIVAPLAPLAVYPIKYDAKSLRSDIARLEQDIQQEKISIDILKAEWAFLTQPKRLEKLAGEVLNLAPTQPETMRFHIQDLPFRTTKETSK
ncbi:MAG: hypothetical protein OXF24_07385 [Hyphomicrobiales bacterium]|nr:hypothetical protein [Hyphomicrobiales bacterium]MCY4049393.1 hypothetical protein [Hyphomicrobiales bacterium]MCY4052404.1 hypothetical protein [Hyphomicrobiales bacterium]